MFFELPQSHSFEIVKMVLSEKFYCKSSISTKNISCEAVKRIRLFWWKGFVRKCVCNLHKMLMFTLLVFSVVRLSPYVGWRIFRAWQIYVPFCVRLTSGKSTVALYDILSIWGPSQLYSEGGFALAIHNKRYDLCSISFASTVIFFHFDRRWSFMSGIPGGSEKQI